MWIESYLKSTWTNCTHPTKSFRNTYKFIICTRIKSQCYLNPRHKIVYSKAVLLFLHRQPNRRSLAWRGGPSGREWMGVGETRATIYLHPLGAQRAESLPSGRSRRELPGPAATQKLHVERRELRVEDELPV